MERMTLLAVVGGFLLSFAVADLFYSPPMLGRLPAIILFGTGVVLLAASFLFDRK